MVEIRLDGDSVTSVADLARRHGMELTRFAYLLCGDRTRAEDLVQDVLLAMHRRFGDSLTVEKPLAYARRAVANANVSWSRRGARAELLTDRAPDRATVDADPTDGDALWQLLQTLPQRQRVVLVLRYYLDYTDDEIAGVLNCRRGTVRSLASRGTATLRGSTGLSIITGSES